MQHVKNSLLVWREEFKISFILRKTELEYTSITNDNYLEKQSEWKPYLRRDISAVNAREIKYDKVMEESVGENMTQNLHP